MDKVKAKIIVEIMGRPPEHLTYALNALIDKMGAENGVKIIAKKIHTPKSVKEAKDIYTTFAEIETEIDGIERFLGVIMAYMPANVEIFEPTSFKMQANDMNAIANYIISRLHKYDEITKRVIFERDILAKQLEETKSGKKIDNTITLGKGKKTRKKSK